MKLRNKILLILICVIGLFLISGNKTFATFDFEYNGKSYSVSDPQGVGTIPETQPSDNYVAVLITDFNYSGVPYIYVAFSNNSNNIKVKYFSDVNRINLYGGYFYVPILVYDENSDTWSWSGYRQGWSPFDVDLFGGTYDFVLSSQDVLDYDDSTQVVFRQAGGSSGGNGLQNPYGEYNYTSDNASGGEYVDSTFEDSTDGGWLSKLIDWLKAPFQKLAQLLAKIFNFFVDFIQRLLAGLFDFFETIFVPDTDDIIFDDVKETLLNKFPFIDSFRQIQIDFISAFDNEENCPTFTITLPEFLGGVVVSPIDFRFYNQYRSWIHGFIIAGSYFIFIRKMYYKIPKMIKGE